MGDYLGINASNGWVYPSWADNRTGSVMTYVSPYQTNPLSRPRDLTASVEFETGISSLMWNYVEEAGFTYFNVYRENELIGTATDTVFSDVLPDYGIYSYRVTAFYEGIGESSSVSTSVQWGDARISVEPGSISETLMPDSSVTRYITVSNVGQLGMDYELSLFVASEPNLDPMAYCAASGTCDEFISRVQFNEIDNSSSCTEYGDYTDQTATVSVGSAYQITVTNGNPIYTDDKCGLWIDWNQDEVFSSDERILMNGSPGVGPYTATIIPPANALGGTTRLRTRIVYFGDAEPCGTTIYGEAEDYSVNVLTWIQTSPLSGSIPAGEEIQIGVTLDAANLEVGTYTAEISIFSNDPDIPVVVVPVTLLVSEIDMELSADQTVLCHGDSAQLIAGVSGGSGTYTYSWTSDPEGFVSTEASPVVTPDTTTTYFLEVSDGLFITSGSIVIMVNPLPEVNLGADTLICNGSSMILSAGEGHTSVAWSTGETGTEVTVGTAGEYWVEVFNEWGCSSRDTMVLSVMDVPASPEVTLGPLSVDNYLGLPSEYSCGEVAGALSYTWTLSPETAGTLTADGLIAEVAWTAGFTGTAQIIVYAANDCGDGAPSEAFVTDVFSSQGLGEMNQDALKVFPNPGEGRFNLQLPSNITFSGDIRVTDAGGALVYSARSLSIPANSIYSLNLSTLPAGNYSVQLRSEDGTAYHAKIIIQRK
jgi:hypothetical protein